jgi:signal transduction histidine kinase
METLFQQVLNLLIGPPGNLIYHLVLAFAIISCLQATLIARRNNASPLINRMVLGLLLLLLGQAVLFFSSGLAWQGVLNERLFLPPLDRAIFLFSLVWVVWLWSFPRPARLGDMVTGFLNLAVIILFLFTYTGWSAQVANTAGQASFNNNWLDWVWELSALFIVLTGMAVLIFSRPEGWGFGFGMLSLLLTGVIVHLVFMQKTGDLSGYLRLAQLAAFPILPALLNRVTPAAQPKNTPASAETASQPRSAERRRYSATPRSVHAWLGLVHESDPEKVVREMAKAVAHTMLSDLCYIIGKPAYGHVVLQCGYDLIREEPIEGTMLDQSQLPTLYNAVQRGKPVRVTAEDPQPADLKALAIALGLAETGSIMFLPLGLADKPLGGLLFLSPYSNRQWSPDDQTYLASEIETITRILQRSLTEGEAQHQDNQAMETLRSQLDHLREENQNLLSEIGELHKSNGHAAAASAASANVAAAAAAPLTLPDHDLNALVALQQEAQDQIAGLQAENERLNAALRDKGITVFSPEEFSRVENEMRATLQEIAQLQNELAEANARNLMLQHDAKQAAGMGNENGEEHEVVTSLVQEIRQPMSSILGYTDLLLAESVGILGAMQRKFIERVKASAERMRSILDDLIQVTITGQSSAELLPKPVELGSIIDSSVLDTSAQIREKDIALMVDLPEDLPQVYADQDAISQIVVQLLQNAGTATPPEGTITLRARIRQDQEYHYLLIQVIDTGGGIHPDDLARVFSRRFRADLPLIQGLGDTGVGLSIAKALAEAHGGRIWVESNLGKNTTMSVLLPVQMRMPEDNS